jgi:mannose-6-phosphate isomerase-like protein (cupin superfamily)
MDKITEIVIDGVTKTVNYVESMDIKAGVVCDIYEFTEDDTKDLAVVNVSKGHKTPLQKILKGESTIEGYISGDGALSVDNGLKKEIYIFPSNHNNSVEVKVGSIIQWSASESTDLVFYEVCTPPYEEGRFENIKN